jgi:thioredoxin reductase (NADPH)
MPQRPSHRTRCAIIGSGPAGYTAAIYAARALLKPVLVTGVQPGGQLTVTTEVENFPGFAQAIQGPQLMDEMRAQAANVGAEIHSDIVSSVDLTRRPFRIALESGSELLAETLIIATGAQAQWLGLPSEKKFQGFGVSACATCDGFFHRGKPVVVVGGGNTAVEEALFLATYASSVAIIHRRAEFRAEKILQDRLLANPRIQVIWNTVLEEVLGAEDPPGVNAVRIRDLVSGESRVLATHGVFIAIGHAPASELFAGQLERNAAGYIKVRPGTAATDVSGVFAAGDVADGAYRQAVTAAAMGCMAALEAARFLAEEDHRRAQHARMGSRDEGDARSEATVGMA